MGNRTIRTYRKDQDKTVRKKEPSFLPLHKLHTLFRLHYTPERNVQHSWSDFFGLKNENGESAADVWKRILEVKKTAGSKTLQLPNY